MATHHSQLYRSLRAVDPRDFQRIIRTYEERENDIGRLDVTEHFELTVSYVNALFETGAYRRHQLMVEPVIEACIREDLRSAPGVAGDVFTHLLFRKAAAAYNLRDFATAEHVTRELIRMHPARNRYTYFARACLFHRKQRLLQFGRGAFIFMVLLTGLATVGNLLVVRNFYAAYESGVRYLSGGLLLGGLLVLSVVYGYALWSSHREARQIQRAAANKRRSKGLH